jgi:hypothetical protein
MADKLLPPLTELTTDEAHRLICADYLRAIASLIERGACQAFEFSWTVKAMHKPAGRIVMDSNFLVSGAESELLQKVEEASRKIQVEDLTDKLKSEDVNTDDTVLS